MLTTNKFVMLHFPKTGSTFARRVIRKICKPVSIIDRAKKKLGLYSFAYQELKFPQIDLADPYIDGLSPHGTYRQIQFEHQHKTIVSITRNPFERYISAYYYGNWRERPRVNLEEIRKWYPYFPDITFFEFYEMINKVHRNFRMTKLGVKRPKIDLGLHSIQFIQFYCQEPEKVLLSIDDDYIARKQITNDMPDIFFLHQENLNHELFLFLESKGYPRKKIQFIKRAPKVNVSTLTQVTSKTNALITAEFIENVMEKDKLIFSVFPEYLETAKTLMETVIT